jgi:hypothetical protein
MKVKSIPQHFAVALLLLTISSCDETTVINNYTGTGEEKTYSIEGYAQKGPFIVGSNVTVSELNEELYPTGKVFFATILDNKGRFELPGVILVSPYIQIKVEGSYFSEVPGGVGTGEILTLYSIADIRKSETINVNILTHLEKERVAYLVQEESKSFSEAKEQALGELLDVFNLDDYDVDASEGLNMLNESEGSAVLLAVSSIIEGFYYYERKLELITNFQKDFQDGALDSEDIQNSLLTSAFCLEPQRIINHLTARFPDITMPDFEPVLEHFIDNSEYTNYFSEIFVQPQGSSINLLNHENSALNSNEDYMLFVNPPPGVDVVVMVELMAKHYADEGGFNVASSVWSEGNVDSSCTLEGNPHCMVY